CLSSFRIMNKLALVSAVLLAVAHAAPDLLSGLTDSADKAAEAVAEIITTAAPIDSPTTGSPANSTAIAQGTAEQRTRLLAKLFKDYDKHVNPDNVNLRFGVALIDFHVLEERDALESYVWLRYVWQDDRLKWDPEESGVTNVIRLDSSLIWKPDVTLYNSADPVNMINCWQSNVLIYPKGEVLWVPPCKMLSRCHLTLKKQPYGEQTCTLKFGSWTFDGFVLGLDLYKANKTIDLSDLNNSSEFEVLSTSAKKNDRYYSCCPEPYSDLTFNMTIKRIPGDELIKKW
ncbi:Acetylcholine receptor subunit beta-like 1, partial [Orchesella cincta]